MIVLESMTKSVTKKDEVQKLLLKSKYRYVWISTVYQLY